MITVPKSVGKGLYRLEQHLKGKGEIFEYLAQIEQNQYMPAEELAALQWKKTTDLLKHASATVPYYKNLFETLKLDVRDIRTYEDFLRIPILTKETIRANKEKMVSDSFLKTDLIENFSSGSTGTPLSFYQTQQFAMRAKAHQLRNYKWCGYEIGDRFSLLWGSELYFKSKHIWDKIENFLINRIELNTFKLTEQTMLRYAETLRAFRPTLVSTYPSSMYLIAKAMEKHGIAPVSVPCIQTTSEILPPDLRRFITRSFGANVYDKYGSRETNVIAHECPNNEGMHLNIENTFVEFLQDGRPVSHGQTGEVVVTNLNNWGMPLIRYRMDDLAAPIQGACSCGITLPRMSGLYGRKTDMIRTTDGGYVDSYLFSFILMRYQEINVFQIVQETPEEIVVRLHMIAPPRPGFESEVSGLIRKFADPGFTVRYEYLSEPPTGASGKHRTTISKVTA